MSHINLKSKAAHSVIVSMLFIVVPTAHAANCSAPGGLVFLGKNSDLTRSVWLSGTGSGEFALQEPNNSAVDTWSKSRRGLHISLSPVVSQGSGLPHTLVDVTGAPCEIDSKNQKGGIVFPPVVQLPPKLPPILKPPSERPSLPGLMPTFPEGGLLPGGGLPSLPGAPGAAVPPIANLPSSGITPSRPSIDGFSRPNGVTPSVPMGVQPPVASLPPSGMTPSMPSTVAPPLGTLPPSGLTPNAPMGVQPPVAGLSPNGMTPSMPSTVTPLMPRAKNPRSDLR
jgi:hypothetical protein